MYVNNNIYQTMRDMSVAYLSRQELDMSDPVQIFMEIEKVVNNLGEHMFSTSSHMRLALKLDLFVTYE